MQYTNPASAVSQCKLIWELKIRWSAAPSWPEARERLLFERCLGWFFSKKVVHKNCENRRTVRTLVSELYTDQKKHIISSRIKCIAFKDNISFLIGLHKTIGCDEKTSFLSDHSTSSQNKYSKNNEFDLDRTMGARTCLHYLIILKMVWIYTVFNCTRNGFPI